MRSLLRFRLGIAGCSLLPAAGLSLAAGKAPAHPVEGDLPLARSRPPMSFGEGGGPTAGDKVADLREEAVVRLKGYRTTPPLDYVPRDLLQLYPEQKHAVAVATQKSRLYLYQNDKGTPRFVAAYYISQRKLGAKKFGEGDNKRKVNAGKRRIKAGTENTSMLRNPGEEEYVVVTLEQDYRSSKLSDQMKKRQDWSKDSGRWKIALEGVA